MLNLLLWEDCYQLKRRRVMAHVTHWNPHRGTNTAIDYTASLGPSAAETLHTPTDLTSFSWGLHPNILLLPKVLHLNSDVSEIVSKSVFNWAPHCFCIIDLGPASWLWSCLVIRALSWTCWWSLVAVSFPWVLWAWVPCKRGLCLSCGHPQPPICLQFVEQP